MDNEHARLILSAYRPDGSDASDPAFAEALAQAQRDPELGAWLAVSRAEDARMQDALRAVLPPAGFKEQLLLASKVSAMPEARRRLPAWWSVAAVAALLLVAGWMGRDLLRPRAALTVHAITMELGRLQRENAISLGVLTTDRGRALEWLRTHDGTHDFHMPRGLETLPGIGCQVLDIRGQKVTLMCFLTPDQDEVHLVVADRSRFKDAPDVGCVVYLQDGDFAFAAWSDATRTYMVTARGSTEKLKRWL
jgi:hypothetical protein